MRVSIACLGGFFADIFYRERDEQHVIMELNPWNMKGHKGSTVEMSVSCKPEKSDMYS